MYECAGTLASSAPVACFAKNKNTLKLCEPRNKPKIFINCVRLMGYVNVDTNRRLVWIHFARVLERNWIAFLPVLQLFIAIEMEQLLSICSSACALHSKCSATTTKNTHKSLKITIFPAEMKFNSHAYSVPAHCRRRDEPLSKHAVQGQVHQNKLMRITSYLVFMYLHLHS